MAWERSIYFIQSGGEDGPIKIGITADPELRLKRLQTGSAEPLALLGTVKGDEDMERAYHAKLATHRVRGEWFAPTPEVMACVPRPFVTSGTPEGDREQFQAVLNRKLIEAELREKPAKAVTRYARCGFVRAEHPGTKDGTVGKADYYEESFMIAMEEAGCWHLVEQMTKEQRAEVGAGIAGSVEHEGMAFYTPPASDRYNQIEREWAAKYRRLEAEFERYQDTAEKHMKRVLRVWPDTPVTISEEGVYRHDGRTTQIA